MARQIQHEAGLSTSNTTLDDAAAAYARKAAAAVAQDGSEEFEVAYTEAFDRALATLRRSHTEGRDQVAYYTDNGAGESAGVWWTRSSVPAQPNNPFRTCLDGGEVDGRVLRDLAAGRDSGSLEPLVRTAATGRRSSGYDLQFAAPKTVSVLAAFAAPEDRAKILAAHDRAVRRALDYTHAAGLIVTRTGAQGRNHTSAVGVSAAVYRHVTSRAQDPHLHSHAVLLNLCVRSDGLTGALDNRAILRNAGGIAALYRGELANTLRAELGFEPVRSGRNFEIAGVAEPVLKLFSKRRAAIEQAARERGFDTADDRVAAQAASYGTRARKNNDTSLAALMSAWERQLIQGGWAPVALFEGVRIAARGIRETRMGSPAERLQRLTEAGLSEALTMQVLVEARELVCRIAETLQCDADADAVLKEVERLRRGGTVVEIGRSTAGEPVYTTPGMIEVEQEMLRRAYARQNERDFVPGEVVTRVLAEQPSLRAEQRAAVRHALNRDGISLVEGRAGSGKSDALASVAAIVRSCGGDVWVIAPPRAAVNVIRDDRVAALAIAQAVTGFLNRLVGGEIALGTRALVIADEAGMLGTCVLAALVEATSAAGAKLILAGDTRQLAPMAAGAPMRLLAQALGASRTDQIPRQYGRSEAEGAWMRAASADFAAGRTASALEAYNRRGAITWCADRKAAIAALIDAYVASRIDPKSAQRSRVVLTGWNADARELNARIRDRLRREGMLPDGRDIEIAAIPRGGSRAEILSLTVGDELIFGESVEVGDQTVRNADLARVEALCGDPADPRLTLRFLKNGLQLSARSSSLVGVRQAGEPQVPRLQHAYAVTTHLAQGLTADEAYVADLRGASADSTYIAMTRHRRTVCLVVNTAPIRERLRMVRSGIQPEKNSLQGGREAVHPTSTSIGQSEIWQAFLAASARRSGKVNVAAYVGSDLRGWCGAPARSREVSVKPGGRMGLGHEGGWTNAIAGIAPATGCEASPNSQALRQRLDERLHASAAYPVPGLWRSSPTIPFVPDAPEQRSQISHLVRVLWQGLRRQTQTSTIALQGLHPGTFEQFSADIRLDSHGRPTSAFRDRTGRIVGLEQTNQDQSGTESLMRSGMTSLPRFGD